MAEQPAFEPRTRYFPREYDFPREVEHPLSPIAETGARVLMWTQEQPLLAAYELWAEDRVVATLRYRGPFQSGALAASTDGLWTIDEMGGRQSNVMIQSGSRSVGQVLHTGGLTDIITFQNGRSFFWGRRGLFSRERFVATRAGKHLLLFQPESGVKARLRVVLLPGARHNPDLSLLAILGKYLMLSGR